MYTWLLGGMMQYQRDNNSKYTILHMGLKGIAAASESITDRQFLPKHSNVLEDSPPALKYEKNSRKLNRFLLLRVPIINSLPNPTLLPTHYISAPKLILDSVYRRRNCTFLAMVIRHCRKKIVQRCNKYGTLFDHIDNYLTRKDQELSGIWKYLAYFGISTFGCTDSKPCRFWNQILVDLKMVTRVIKYSGNVYKRPLTQRPPAKSTLKLKYSAIFRVTA